MLRIDDNHAIDPRVLALSDAAFRLEISMKLLSSRLGSDGEVARVALETLGVRRWKSAISELVAAGLVVDRGATLYLPTFLEWNESGADREKRRKLTRERQRRFQDKLSSSNAESNALGTRRADAAKTPSGTGTDPVPEEHVRTVPPNSGRQKKPTAVVALVEVGDVRIELTIGWAEIVMRDTGVRLEEIKGPFANWLAAEIRSGLVVAQRKFRLTWQDEQVARWLRARSASVSDALARRTEAFIAEQAEHAARRATPEEVLEGLRAGRAGQR